MLYHQHTNYRIRTRNSNDFVSHDPDNYTMNHTLLHTSQPSSVLYIVGSIHLADECILATYTPYFFFHASTALCNERTLTASYIQNNTALTIFTIHRYTCSLYHHTNSTDQGLFSFSTYRLSSDYYFTLYSMCH